MSQPDTNPKWRQRLDADDYPDTPAGLRQWAQDGAAADRAYYAEIDLTRRQAIAVLADEGHPELARRVQEMWV